MYPAIFAEVLVRMHADAEEEPVLGLYKVIVGVALILVENAYVPKTM